ncbi:MAG: hypothetical protein ACP59X_00500 [Solidesulfovibrio sp. DCME]|uniref:hypothetical protein n=1 Tax=Solidesulfovibrio sp. DCME TaxID=3447380 RepID=UPI003D0FEDA4
MGRPARRYRPRAWLRSTRFDQPGLQVGEAVSYRPWASSRLLCFSSLRDSGEAAGYRPRAW